MDYKKYSLDHTKLWVYRKNRLNNIEIIFKADNKKNSIIERKMIKRLESINLKFTRFSTYFKQTQHKKKGLIGTNTSIIVQILKKYKQLKKLKSYGIFSIYKNRILIRYNLEKFFSALYKLNRLNSSHAKFTKDSVTKGYPDSRLNISLDFQRKFHLFVRSLKIIKLNKTDFKKADFNVLNFGEIFTSKYIFFYKLDFVLDNIRLFFFNFLFFFTKKWDVNYKMTQSLQQNFFGFSCKVFFRKKFISESNCLVSSKKSKILIKNYKKNSFLKKQKLLSVISKEIMFWIPERKNFSIFFATFSLKNGWKIKKFNLVNFKKYLPNYFKKKHIFLNLKNVFRSRIFFLKEINLILNLLSIYIDFPASTFKMKNYFYEKPILENLNFELEWIKKGFNYFKLEYDRSLFFDFLAHKKKSWYENSFHFFWYIFSKFSPSFSLSEGLFSQLARRTRQDMNLNFFGSNTYRESSKNKKIFLNWSSKKNKIIGRNFKSHVKIDEKGLNKNDHPIKFYRQKKAIIGLKKSTTLPKPSSFIYRKSGLSDFLFLKKSSRKIEIPNRLQKGLKKNIEIFDFKIGKNYVSLQNEISDRCGYIFIKKIIIELSFLDLPVPINLNRKENEKVLKKSKISNRVFIRSNDSLKIERKHYTNIENFGSYPKLDFLFGNRLEKINFALDILRTYIKKQDLNNKNIFKKLYILPKKVKENFEYRNFIKINRKFLATIQDYPKEIVRFFF